MRVDLFILCACLVSFWAVLTVSGGPWQAWTWYRHMITSMVIRSSRKNNSTVTMMSSYHEQLRQQLRDQTRELHTLQARLDSNEFIPISVHEELKSRALAMAGEMLSMRASFDTRESRRALVLAQLDKDCHARNMSWIEQTRELQSRLEELQGRLKASEMETKVALNQVDELMKVRSSSASVTKSSRALEQDLMETRRALEEAREGWRLAREAAVTGSKSVTVLPRKTKMVKTIPPSKPRAQVVSSSSSSSSSSSQVMTVNHLAQLADAMGETKQPIKTLSSNNNNRPTIKIDCGKESYVFSTIRSGDAYSSTVASSANRCKKMCAGEPHCKSWVFVTLTGMCHLKDKYGVASQDDCCVAGVRCSKG